MGILRTLKFSKKPFGLQSLINSAYYNPSEVMVRPKDVDYVVMENCKFYPTEHMNTLVKPLGNPWFEGIGQDDVVLDIGACIGSVTIPLAKKCKKVIAVEPLYWRELEANVKLNNLTNVEVLNIALGDFKGLEVEYGSRTSSVICQSFGEILKYASTVDFLKVDCEGAEWSISPLRLLEIREVRIEYHLPRKGYKDFDKVLGLIRDQFGLLGYKVVLDRDAHKGGFSPEFKEVAYLRASKNESNS